MHSDADYWLTLDMPITYEKNCTTIQAYILHICRWCTPFQHPASKHQGFPHFIQYLMYVFLHVRWRSDDKSLPRKDYDSYNVIRYRWMETYNIWITTFFKNINNAADSVSIILKQQVLRAQSRMNSVIKYLFITFFIYHTHAEHVYKLM